MDVRRETPHFRLHAVPGSFADRNLGLVASRLEGAYAIFAELLAIEAEPAARIAVYLPEVLDAGLAAGRPASTHLAGPVKATPIAESRGSTPLAESLERTPLAGPLETTHLAGPLKATPFTESLQATPFAEPLQATPFAEPLQATPLAGPLKATPFAEPLQANADGSIVEAYRADAPAPDLERSLLLALVRATGRTDPPPALFVDGLLSICTTRTGGTLPGAAGSAPGGSRAPGPNGARGGRPPAASGPPPGSPGPVGSRPPGGAPPSGGPANGPRPFGGGPPGGGPPDGGAPGAGRPGGGPPGGGPPGGGPPGGGPPGGGPPGGGPPGGGGGRGGPGSPLFQAKRAGTLPPVRALLEGPTPATLGVYLPAAASFVDYLVRTHGAADFRRFVTQVTSPTSDAAAQAVYHATLGQLDSAWRRTLKPPPTGGVFEFLRSLLPYLRPHWLRVIEIIIEIGVGVAYITYVATVQRSLFDDGILKNDLGVVLRIIGTLVALFIVSSLVALRQNYATAQVSQSVLRDIRLQIFSLIQRLDAGFFQRMQTGDILSRVTSDLSMIEFPIGMGLAQGARMVLMLVLAVGALLLQSPRFAIVLLLATPLFFLTARYLGPAAARASRQRQQNLAIVTSTIQENIGAQPVVKAFGLESLVIAQYTRQLQVLFTSAIRFSVLTGFTGLAAQSITTVIQLIALGLGAWLVIAGSSTVVGAWLSDDAPLTVGSLPTLLALMAQVVASMQGMNGLLQMFQQASGPMERINDLLRTRPAIVDAPNARPLGRVSNGIRFEDVSFGYSLGQPVVQDVSLTIPAGSTVGLVGPSGCGKSTLLGLLQRFYDPQTGTLSVDGVDARQLTVASLRAQMGVVFQDNILFNTSIRDNIRFGRPGASDADVEEAARQAEMHDMVLAMPEGYDTVVGERGSRLSGGQRQRVAIARAMIRDPAMLILDEATSALDPTTEAAVNATLQRVGVGRTTISVSHRLAGIAHADQIYVLDRGAVVEHGTHAELLEHGGLYAQLWDEQTAAVAAAGAPLSLDVGRLKSIPLFASLPPGELAGVARRLHAERYAVGETIITQGDAGDKLYLLEQGQVEVVVSDVAGGERQLAILREGDYFGEVALVRDVQRTASIRALTSTLVDTLSKEDLLREMASVPTLREAVERTTGQRSGGKS